MIPIADSARNATLPAANRPLAAPTAGAAGEAEGADRLDAVIWSLIAVTAALVAVSAPIGGFRPLWSSFAGPGAALVLLGAAALFYCRVRRDPKAAAALGGTVQLIAFAAVGAPLSYVATALSSWMPLQDRLLDAADKALGLDWPGVLTWMDAHAAWDPMLRTAYGSITLQASVAILALAFAGRMIQLRVFLLAFVLATLIAIAVAAVVPAYGAWDYYAVTPQDFSHLDPVVRDLPVPIIEGLRNGSYRELLAIGAEGIITFPSLHSAFAVILAVAFWPLPVLRWIGLALNVVMLASTPIDGAHFFVDIFAGLAVAAIAIGLARVIAARATAPAGTARA
jgi:hypothetical protein